MTARRLPRGVAAVAMVAVLMGLAVSVLLGTRYSRYRNETARLRAGMTDAQRERADLVIEAERHRFRVELELIRRQAFADRELHLAVNVDSGYMLLERDGVELRRMAVQLSPHLVESMAGDTVISVEALGERTVERVLGKGDEWQVPPSAWTSRGLTAPEDRTFSGSGILLNGGILIYAIPASGALADGVAAPPGSVRVSADDMAAIAPNITTGMPAYFYRS